jgi:hypothetical protein
MTTKKPIIILIVLLLVIAGGLAVFAYTKQAENNRNDSRDLTTTEDKDTQQGTATVETGRYILLTQFDTKFALPKSIDETDTRIAYKKTDRYEVAVVTSPKLADNLKKDQCWGGTLELGSYAEITRYATPPEGQELDKIGNYYYRVDEGPGHENCYDAPLYEKYYDPAVIRTIRETLQKQ